MSFGLSKWDSQVADAIERASKSTILFAAASNYGGNGGRSFPATDSRVICVHASDGKGNDHGGMNPSTESFHDRWSTLGVAIKFIWNDKPICKSGTSYATPIAAGAVANALDFVNYLRDQGMLSVERCQYLRRYDGVRRLLWLMSEERDNFRYVAPWHLWDDDATEEYVYQKLLRNKG
jgi:hypothetical protein